MTQEATVNQPSNLSPSQRRRRRRKPRVQRELAPQSNADERVTNTLQIQTARVLQNVQARDQRPQTSRTAYIRPPPPPPSSPPPATPPPPPPPPPPASTPTRPYRHRRGNGGPARLHSAASPIASNYSALPSTDLSTTNRRGGPRRGGNRRGVTGNAGNIRPQSAYNEDSRSPQASGSPTGNRNQNRQYRARRGAPRGPPRSDHTNGSYSGSPPNSSTQGINTHRGNAGQSRGGTTNQRTRDQSSRYNGGSAPSSIPLATQMLRTVAEQWSGNTGTISGPATSRAPSIPILPHVPVSSSSAHMSRNIHFSPLSGGGVATATTSVSSHTHNINLGATSYTVGLERVRVPSPRTSIGTLRRSWVQLLPTRRFTIQNAPRERQCSICLEDLVGAHCRVLPCFHAFHSDCVDQWFELNDTCPLDRKCVPRMLRQSGQYIGSDDESRSSWGTESRADFYESQSYGRMHPPIASPRHMSSTSGEMSSTLLSSVGRMVRTFFGLGA